MRTRVFEGFVSVEGEQWYFAPLDNKQATPIPYWFFTDPDIMVVPRKKIRITVEEVK